MRSALTVLLWCALAVAAGACVLWLLPLAAPFLIAFAAAAAMEPLVAALHRRGVSRTCASGILTAVLLVLLGGTVMLAASGAFRRLSDLVDRAPELLERLAALLADWKGQALALTHTVPEPLSADLATALDTLSDEVYAIPVRLSEQLLALVTDWARRSPDALLFAATTAIGVYFFSAYYRDMMDFLKRQFPAAWLGKAQRAWRELKKAAAGCLKVQCLLSLITFGELLLAFLLLRIPRALPIAAVTALIDALPVLGSGTVLLPWALWCFLSADPARALGLLAAYGVISSVRGAVQARLMDRQMGLHPVVSLIAVYVGWKLCGLAGMLFLPLAAVVLQELNNAGILHLYRTE